MKSDKVFLNHILEEITFLLKEKGDMDFESFMKNEIFKRASARSIEIIGEATKNISPDLKAKHRNIDWKNIAGMRDKIIHLYFGVNWDIVWDAITKKMPVLKQKIDKILKETAED